MVKIKIAEYEEHLQKYIHICPTHACVCLGDVCMAVQDFLNKLGKALSTKTSISFALDGRENFVDVSGTSVDRQTNRRTETKTDHRTLPRWGKGRGRVLRKGGGRENEPG